MGRAIRGNRRLGAHGDRLAGPVVVVDQDGRVEAAGGDRVEAREVCDVGLLRPQLLELGAVLLPIGLGSDRLQRTSSAQAPSVSSEQLATERPRNLRDRLHLLVRLCQHVGGLEKRGSGGYGRSGERFGRQREAGQALFDTSRAVRTKQLGQWSASETRKHHLLCNASPGSTRTSRATLYGPRCGFMRAHAGPRSPIPDEA